MEAANSLTMPYSVFMALGEEDRARQITYVTTKARMRAWEQQEQEVEMERASRGRH